MERILEINDVEKYYGNKGNITKALKNVFKDETDDVIEKVYTRDLYGRD